MTKRRDLFGPPRFVWLEVQVRRARWLLGSAVDLESVANQLMPKTVRSSRYEEIEDDD